MNLKRPLVLLEKYGLATLVVLTAVAFLAACTEAMFPAGGGGLSLWEAASVTYHSDQKSAEGWTKVMHVMMTATLGWAATRVYMATAGFTWDTFSARYLLRRHVVIVAGPLPETRKRGAHPSRGEGRQGSKSALAVELAISLAHHNRVVLSLPTVEDDTKSRLWNAGVTLLKGDFDTPSMLTAAGVARARMLVAMRDDPADNLALTRVALSPALGNPALECRCMLEPLSSKRLFKLEDYIEPATLPRARVFNEAEFIARRMLTRYPPDAPVALTDDRVHVLLVGLGSVGQSILVQLAGQGHYRSGLKPLVTIVDGRAEERWNEAIEAHAALGDLLDVALVESRIEQITRQTMQDILRNDTPVTVAYVCTRDEIVNLRIVRLLLTELEARDQDTGRAPVQVVALDPPGGCILSDFASHGTNQERLHLFSLMTPGDLASPGRDNGLLSDMDDRRARQLHDAYCASQAAPRDATPNQSRNIVAITPWELLSEDLRDSNRASADHFDVKMRAVGRRLVPRDSAEESPLSSEEVELLARMEHARWCAQRFLAGWTYGPIRDDPKRIHPSLVPWEPLSELEKQKDRDNVTALINTVRGEGLVLAAN